jgi:hypothetical protein
MRANQILSICGMMVLLSACGSKTATTTLGASTSPSTPSGVQTGFLNGNGTGNIYNLPQAPENRVEVSGSSGPSPSFTKTIQTSRTLKVKVTALNAPQLTIPGYENWVFPYGCMQVTVSVNGVSQTTQVLRVSSVAQGATSPCANAPDRQTLDFSNAMTGNGPVTITVTNPQYDNCRYYWPLNYGCQISAVWSNHMVAATIATQVDGTWMDP